MNSKETKYKKIFLQKASYLAKRKERWTDGKNEGYALANKAAAA
jgi:hypothetical protein